MIYPDRPEASLGSPRNFRRDPPAPPRTPASATDWNGLTHISLTFNIFQEFNGCLTNIHGIGQAFNVLRVQRPGTTWHDLERPGTTGDDLERPATWDLKRPGATGFLTSPSYFETAGSFRSQKSTCLSKSYRLRQVSTPQHVSSKMY